MGDAFGTLAVAAEDDDGLAVGQGGEQLLECLQLIGHGRLHLIECQLALLRQRLLPGLAVGNPLREVQLLVGLEVQPRGNRHRMGGAGEQCLPTVGEARDDETNLLLETQFEALVVLVQHQMRELLWVDVLALDVVLQSAACADDEVGPLIIQGGEALVLDAGVVSAIAQHRPDSQLFGHVANLLRQFARGHDHQTVRRCLRLCHQGQEEGRRLAASRGRQEQDVLPRNGCFEHFRLHHIQAVEAQCLNCFLLEIL